MEAGNLLTITYSNLRLNIKQTLLPAALLLLVIPLVYGTSNLDSAKSAECLERMVALVGLPMFVPLLRPEQEAGIDAMIVMRPFPYRAVVMLRVALSIVGAAALILAFEGYMRASGCTFPVGIYALRTLAAAMTLGFVGLMASAVSRSTALGFLVSFCWYCALQIESVGAAFRCVSNGIGVQQALALMVSGGAIIFFSGASFGRKTA